MLLLRQKSQACLLYAGIFCIYDHLYDILCDSFLVWASVLALFISMLSYDLSVSTLLHYKARNVY